MRCSIAASTCSASTSATARRPITGSAWRPSARSRRRPAGRSAFCMDLQGPKLRVGTFAARPGAARGRRRRSGSTSIQLPATPTRVCLPHPEIFAVLKPGLQLLLDDGKLRLEVERSGDGYAMTRVIGGRQALRAQRRQHPRRDRSAVPAHRRRTAATSSTASSSAPTGSRCRSCSARRTSTKRAR